MIKHNEHKGYTPSQKQAIKQGFDVFYTSFGDEVWVRYRSGSNKLVTIFQFTTAYERVDHIKIEGLDFQHFKELVNLRLEELNWVD